MAVVLDEVALSVGFLNLVQRLCDQESFQPVSRHESQGRLEKFESTECREFVQHQQQLMAARLVLQLFGEAPANLIEDKPYERPGAADIGGRNNQIERHRVLGLDKIAYAPITALGDRSDDGIHIEAKERHRGRKDSAAF